MATGTSNDTGLEELKEMVRQMGNRIDILSAANTDLSSKMQKAKETFDAQTADLNARLLKSFERIQELERKNQSIGKESDKITLPAWPAPQGFSRWRESVLAVTVAASADKLVAVKFVGEVDDPHMGLAALLTKRSDEMTSIDSKLYAAILSILPKNEDGDRIHAAIKETCASYCGRQAIRVLEKDFQYQGPRKQKKTIQQMVTLHLEGGVKGLGTFWTSWSEIRQDLKGTPDEPSLRMIGSLLEDKLKKLGETDVPIGIALDNWRSASAATEDPAELDKAYKAFADAVESRNIDQRDGKPAKTAAPAIEDNGGNDEAHKDIDKSHDKSQRPKGRGKGGKSRKDDTASTTGDEKFQGYCSFNKVLCGNWGHQSKDYFCNPESENYKGDQCVKDLIARKQEALQKAVSAAALTGEVGQTAGAAATSTGGSLDGGMSMDNMFSTWLRAQQEVRSGSAAVRMQ